MRFFTLIILLLLTNCATNTIEDTSISYQFLDSPKKNKIELSYQNETGRTICLASEDWPNLAGKINQASDVIFLIVDDKSFPIVEFNTGYCQGDPCVIKVKANEIITGSISYEDFNLPSNARSADKKLVYSPPAYFCD